MQTFEWEWRMSKRPKAPPSAPPPDEDPPTKESKSRMSVASLKEASPNAAYVFETISRKVTEARTSRNMMISNLARDAGLPISTVVSAESGTHNMSIGTLLKIADALQVEVKDLFPGKDDIEHTGEDAAAAKILEGSIDAVLLELNRATQRVQEVRNVVMGLQRPSRTKRKQ